ncbi:short chain dehydrogenase [Hirsutella rhossiliensis]|uniref:Short chain dehydrogenase domain-containing protein n=1 Tax=Hirsutella rhossiliensis TaxID=111463 RepID=A0A9P8N695_9HYPO|nr:short chain dehydrogenase domain-containing protein [Hirsutella rhossiliensis]KAH0966746.1 short chain dehydrogenase domain-containing protein [Hirsutella rhossiliensis]
MPSPKPVALVVGASRGIGRQIALDLARNDYAVVVAAKSVTTAASGSAPAPDPNSPASTITTVAREIASAGGDATAIPVDVRSEQSVADLVAKTISTYHRLDVLIYNPGAIFWASVADTPLRRFQLMQHVNPEGLYAVVQAALPHLGRRGGRIVVVSPPIYSRFFRGKTAYAM